MIDPVAPKPVTNGPRRIGTVAAAVPTPAVRTMGDAPQAPAALTGVAQEMAASAPVDTDHVARIKKALKDGTFPLSPSTIADCLIALKLEWTTNDPS